jgi:hypothetical protein
MPPTDPDSTVEDVGDDRLRGVSQIAQFLKEPERRVSYLIERGIIPAGREGAAIVASKARLREYHRKTTGGGAGTPEATSHQ